ncbi:MAG TPA: hypothetical protein VLA97_06675 [Nocardioidaceae bacterium]|nr:hypothetical protein [Nocardioidaceae bacterium]
MRITLGRLGPLLAGLALITTVTTTGTMATTAPAAAAGCRVDNVSYKILGEGYRIWIGTNVASIWVAGPGRISRTVSKTSTAGSSHSSSDTVEGGVNYGVVSAKYNHTWNRGTTTSAARTSSWTYDIYVPGGMTARARVFKDGRNFPARKTITYQKGSTCPVISRSWKVRVRLPNKATGNQHYCIVRDQKPATNFMRSCKNT